MTVEHFVAANSVTENQDPQLSFGAVISELFRLFWSVTLLKCKFSLVNLATLRENDKTFK